MRITKDLLEVAMVVYAIPGSSDTTKDECTFVAVYDQGGTKLLSVVPPYVMQCVSTIEVQSTWLHAINVALCRAKDNLAKCAGEVEAFRSHYIQEEYNEN